MSKHHETKPIHLLWCGIRETSYDLPHGTWGEP